MNYNHKRKFKRVALDARVIAHDDQDFMYLQCGTISEGGLLLYCRNLPIWSPGSVLKLNIKSDKIPQAFIAEGTILDYIKDTEKGFCLKFSKIEDSDRKLIKEYVEKQYEEKPMKFYLNGTPISSGFEVFVDGELIPRDRENGWDFDFQQNAIIFYGKYVPKKGCKISFSFTDII
jgi:hypothetical protein